MDKSKYVKLSWMDAEKAGVSRRDWCHAMAEKRRGKVYQTPKPSKPAQKARVRTIPLVQWSCSHRGDVVDMTVCGSCGGGKRPLEIFDCAIHGECTVDRMPEPGRTVKGLCKLCKDRVGKPIIE